ncbi:MAG: hypothetical protein LBK71_00560 [Verrucomicrobiales bacterium]|jgi:hypothetical protein|nr:hypothetical protein [Verrucomicrobiales bacterium]
MTSQFFHDLEDLQGWILPVTGRFGQPEGGQSLSALTGTQRKISNSKLQLNLNIQNQNSKQTLNYPGAPRHPFTEGESVARCR